MAIWKWTDLSAVALYCQSNILITIIINTNNNSTNEKLNRFNQQQKRKKQAIAICEG